MVGIVRGAVTKRARLRALRFGGQPSPELRAKAGGGRGIRTPGTVSRSTVFKTAALNRSAIPPRGGDRGALVMVADRTDATAALEPGGSRLQATSSYGAAQP